jgi:hypothetical protein
LELAALKKVVTNLEVGTCFLGTKVSLVGSVSAVIFAITFPSVWNASAIVTAKLAGLTGDIGAALFIYERKRSYINDHCSKMYA